MERNKLIYELGRWGDRYMANLACKQTHFYCFKCKNWFHGVSMYEHFCECSKRFFKKISKPKDKEMVQEYFEKAEDRSIIKKTRKVEVDYVEQGGSGLSGSIGERSEVEKSLLLPLPGEYSKNAPFVLQNGDVEEDAKPDSEEVGR